MFLCCKLYKTNLCFIKFVFTFLHLYMIFYYFPNNVIRKKITYNIHEYALLKWIHVCIILLFRTCINIYSACSYFCISYIQLLTCCRKIEIHGRWNKAPVTKNINTLGTKRIGTRYIS